MDATPTLAAIEGVTRVVATDHRDGLVGFEVDCEQGRDVRRDIARTVIRSGWGLLELRPMRMSLEEIFLSLTTDEAAAADAAPATIPEGDAVNA